MLYCYLLHVYCVQQFFCYNGYPMLVPGAISKRGGCGRTGGHLGGESTLWLHGIFFGETLQECYTHARLECLLIYLVIGQVLMLLSTILITNHFVFCFWRRRGRRRCHMLLVSPRVYGYNQISMHCMGMPCISKPIYTQAILLVKNEQNKYVYI